MCFVAEREGFEPSKGYDSLTHLAGARLQPLGHLPSGTAEFYQTRRLSSTGLAPAASYLQTDLDSGKLECGEVPERTNGTVLKTVEGQPSAGSNPALSAARAPASTSESFLVQRFRRAVSYAVGAAGPIGGCVPIDFWDPM